MEGGRARSLLVGVCRGAWSKWKGLSWTLRRLITQRIWRTALRRLEFVLSTGMAIHICGFDVPSSTWRGREGDELAAWGCGHVPGEGCGGKDSWWFSYTPRRALSLHPPRAFLTLPLHRALPSGDACMSPQTQWEFSLRPGEAPFLCTPQPGYRRKRPLRSAKRDGTRVLVQSKHAGTWQWMSRLHSLENSSSSSCPFTFSCRELRVNQSSVH